jgi:hypothetical protein
MNQNKIVQFVGFITPVSSDQFVERWEFYVQQLKIHKTKSTLQKQSGAKSRFRYISQHRGLQDDFNFSFMKKRVSEHFPEMNVKVVHAGGYIPLQSESSATDRKENINLMVFVKNHGADINFYRNLSLYRKLNIYQAYYENCTYAYIMEFFVKESDANSFMQQIPTGMNHHNGDETAWYEECEMALA